MKESSEHFILLSRVHIVTSRSAFPINIVTLVINVAYVTVIVKNIFPAPMIQALLSFRRGQRNESRERQWRWITLVATYIKIGNAINKTAACTDTS